MSEKKLRKRLDFQKNMITKQSEQIEKLKLQIEELKLKCDEKDKVIRSIDSLKKELEQDVFDVKKRKKEYKRLIDELKKMKKIMNQTVYRGRWWLVRFFIK